jgi:two-component system, OmpR family, sensor kinase
VPSIPVNGRRPAAALSWNMKRLHSIRGRLSLVFAFLFVLLIVVGLSDLSGLRQFNQVSAQIRDRWLPSAHALVDLNNFTSDFRAAEGALLLARDGDELAATKQDLMRLDRSIAAAERAYRSVDHDLDEREHYDVFEPQWVTYHALVDRSQALLAAHGRAEAMRQYATVSKSAYNAASDTLDVISERNAALARAASARADRAYEIARQRIALTILFAALLVAGAMLYVKHSISAPLLDLAGRMHRLAASETTVQLTGMHRWDEIGEMARAVVVFRDNAIDLAASRKGLAQQASMLQEKLAEEQRLAALQRNFVSMASHEFRTPLAIIDGHAQRLISMRDRIGATEVAERARKVRNSVGRMVELMDNLIGSGRMIDAEVELYYHAAVSDLGPVLHDVCQIQRELSPGLQIFEAVPPGPLRVFGDVNLLSQVFGNLLSNAVKYSPHGGLIKLCARLEPDQVVVTVEDQGLGIAARDKLRIFERYYRGSNTTGIGGTGVGLHLVKLMVDLHHGAIEVDSIEGKGSRFTVRLPSRARDPLRRALSAPNSITLIGSGATFI